MHGHKSKARSRILVTGGAGFIGSQFVRSALDNELNEFEDFDIVVLDSLTYAGNLNRLNGYLGDPRLTFIKGNINDTQLLDSIAANLSGIIHFAAESHVDRSIKFASTFIDTNIHGSFCLFEVARKYDLRFVHISTDEVYGSVLEGESTEQSLLAPSSPYSSSKAASDLIGLSYVKTYNLNLSVTRAANNFGKYQDREKLIPTIIHCLRNDLNIPIYGDGKNIRDWLSIKDHVRAICDVYFYGDAGEIYNVGGIESYTNLELVLFLQKYFDSSKSKINFTHDRPGHDRRYSVNSKKLFELRGWKPRLTIAESMEDLMIEL